MPEEETKDGTPLDRLGVRTGLAAGLKNSLVETILAGTFNAMFVVPVDDLPNPESRGVGSAAAPISPSPSTVLK